MSIRFDRFLLAERLAREAAKVAVPSRELVFEDKAHAERVLSGFRHLGESASIEERTDARGSYWVLLISGGGAQ